MSQRAGHPVIGLEAVEAALVRAPGRLFEGDVQHRASVALVLRAEPDDLSLLFIERAANQGDPWSGHVAFPGGRRDPGDSDARATAQRETREELGLDLSSARALGRLDDLPGREASLVVSGFVFAVDGDLARVPLQPNHEVARTRWQSLSELQDDERQVERAFEYRSHTLTLPALRIFDGDGAVLWGLSYRFLELLLARIGSPIPEMPWDTNL